MFSVQNIQKIYKIIYRTNLSDKLPEYVLITCRWITYISLWFNKLWWYSINYKLFIKLKFIRISCIKISLKYAGILIFIKN